ncbi:TPA: helix-turn-helix domain-containing protein [Streptococcus suis]|nr:helix-turn-helix domain-containing protein [Streptococcus suis]
MDLGQKIERLRLEKGLSRPDFCGDESELTVRQLARIESGQSQPSIPKLEYIAQRLGIPAYSLMPDYKELPQGYLELKYKLLREPIYQKEGIIEPKDTYIEQIYVLYHDELPEEEQLTCEIIQAMLDTIKTGRPEYAVPLLEEYLPRLESKSVYFMSDVLLARLYFLQASRKSTSASNVDNVEKLMLKVMKQIPINRIEDCFIIRDTLVVGLCFFEKIGHYDYFDTYLDCLHAIMEKTEDYQKKPLILMLSWKQALRKEGGFEIAEPMFQSAKIFAQIIGNDYLAQKLAEEWQKDLKKYL